MSLEVRGLRFRIGSFELGELDLAVKEGESFVVLGPPGSGKTLFLECLCGLLRPLSGRILIGGRDVTSLPPGKRGIGYVPQDYALFPHLSVEGNILFGLGKGRAGKEEGRKTAARTADLLGIGSLLSRDVTGLSGGERQRVALARALVRKPGLLLLDEPVSALDEATREKVIHDLRELKKELGFTMVYVCHNLEEAFGVADRAGLMGEGKFLQVGPMGELLRRPETLFAARFMRCENILTGRAVRDGEDGGSLLLLEGVRLPLPVEAEGTLTVAVRPEEVRLLPAGASPPGGGGVLLEARLERVEDRGGYTKAEVGTAGPRLTAHLSREEVEHLRERGGFRPGTEYLAWIRPESVLVLRP
ncbi:MAG TPA: ABC transporter ATP-binding protein [Planctomycetes bacterium]|nr:ABC transporter ATP-binding protein [Planctomycetota bacterium]